MSIQKHRKGEPTEVLAELYRGGQTTVEIAEKFNMSPAAVNGRLRRFGIEIRSAKRRTIVDRSENCAAIARLYMRGVPVVELADKFNCGRSSITRALRREGVKMTKCHKQTITLPNDITKIAYIAGLFDGEGNIGFRNNSARVHIYNTSPHMIQWIHSNFGGKLIYDTTRVRRKGWKPIGIWALYRARDVSAFLTAVMPFLTAKKKQAELALKIIGRVQVHDSPPIITHEILPSPNHSDLI